MVNLSDFKEIYKNVKETLTNISSEYSNDFRLEQAFFDTKNNEWDVVISYLAESSKVFPNLPFQPKERIYKKINLDSDKQFLGFLIHNHV